MVGNLILSSEILKELMQEFISIPLKNGLHNMKFGLDNKAHFWAQASMRSSNLITY
jgi:hypothetical protein